MLNSSAVKGTTQNISKLTHKDVQYDRSIGKRKYVLMWGCAVWSSFVFMVLISMCFYVAKYFINIDEMYIVMCAGEMFWYCFVGGIFIGGLSKFLSYTNYSHPDTEIKEYDNKPIGIMSTLIDSGEKYLRGTKMTGGPNERLIQECYKSGEKAANIIRKHIHNNLPEREQAIVFEDRVPATMLAGAPYPYSLENRALFCIGSAGSGKSQVIKELIYGIRKRGGRDKFIFYDRKPEYLPMFYRDGDIVLCPADLRHTNWDVFAEIDGEQDIDGVINSLIPPGGDQKDKFWIDSARGVFHGVLVWLLMGKKEAYAKGEEPFNKPTNEDLVKFLAQTSTDPVILWNVLKKNRATGFIASCLNCADRPNSPTASSIMASLTSYTGSFTRPEVAERGDFSVRKWLRDDKTEGQAIFLANPAKYGDNYESYFTMIVNLALTEMISLPNDNDRRVWFIIDEFGSLMKLGSVIRLLAEGRSKGACTIIGTQDIAQLKERYKEEHETIINNCNSQCIARVTSHNEAKYLSDMIGEMEVEKEESTESVNVDEKGVSVNTKVNNNNSKREKRQVVLPSEISGLPDLTYYVKPSDLGWFKNKIKYYPWGTHDIVLPFIQRPSYYFETIRNLNNTPPWIARAIEDANPNKAQQGGYNNNRKF